MTHSVCGPKTDGSEMSAPATAPGTYPPTRPETNAPSIPTSAARYPSTIRTREPPANTTPNRAASSKRCRIVRRSRRNRRLAKFGRRAMLAIEASTAILTRCVTSRSVVAMGSGPAPADGTAYNNCEGGKECSPTQATGGPAPLPALLMPDSSRPDPSCAVELVAEAELPTRSGEFRICGFRASGPAGRQEIVVLRKGEPAADGAVRCCASIPSA